MQDKKLEKQYSDIEKYSERVERYHLNQREAWTDFGKTLGLAGVLGVGSALISIPEIDNTIYNGVRLITYFSAAGTLATSFFQMGIALNAGSLKGKYEGKIRRLEKKIKKREKNQAS